MFEKYKIVLTPFPFTDLSSSKVRPAVIISEKLLGDDVVIVFISSRTPKTKDNYFVTIKKDSTNNLKSDSVIRMSKIATVDKKIILGEIGDLDTKYRKKIDKKLKTLFGL